MDNDDQGHSPLYWVALAAAGILILLDIYGDGAEYTTIGALAFGALAVLARPGGPLGSIGK
jgi:hypothetical protein